MKLNSEMSASKSHHARSDDGGAFLPDPYAYGSSGHIRTGEPVAESLAEDFVSSATSGEEAGPDRRDALSAYEMGGPFVETQAKEEFATTIDEMNPEDAIPEPFPTANGRSF
jgi:hypothetical protein